MGIIVDAWHRLALSASLVSDVTKKPYTFVLDMKIESVPDRVYGMHKVRVHWITQITSMADCGGGGGLLFSSFLVRET